MGLLLLAFIKMMYLILIRRIRTTKLNTIDVSLQAMATIAEGETIGVRWNIDAGTLSAKKQDFNYN
jgi:hypothetical protein